jgi:hypothetical protein
MDSVMNEEKARDAEFAVTVIASVVVAQDG